MKCVESERSPKSGATRIHDARCRARPRERGDIDRVLQTAVESGCAIVTAAEERPTCIRVRLSDGRSRLLLKANCGPPGTGTI